MTATPSRARDQGLVASKKSSGAICRSKSSPGTTSVLLEKAVDATAAPKTAAPKIAAPKGVSSPTAELLFRSGNIGVPSKPLLDEM